MRGGAEVGAVTGRSSRTGGSYWGVAEEGQLLEGTEERADTGVGSRGGGSYWGCREEGRY